MRVLSASLFVVGCVFAGVAVLGALGVFDNVHPMVVGIGLSLYLLALCFVALGLFNARGTNPFGLLTLEEHHDPDHPPGEDMPRGAAVALAEHPPKVRYTLEAEEALYAGNTVITKGVRLPVSFTAQQQAISGLNDKLIVTTALEPF